VLDAALAQVPEAHRYGTPILVASSTPAAGEVALGASVDVVIGTRAATGSVCPGGRTSRRSAAARGAPGPH
jgi:hypothetical protein